MKEGRKIRWKETSDLQIELNITYRKYEESTHLSGRYLVSQQLGHLSCLDSSYHSRSHKTTTPSSVDYA
jgi:hypothetical protein